LENFDVMILEQSKKPVLYKVFGLLLMTELEFFSVKNIFKSKFENLSGIICR